MTERSRLPIFYWRNRSNKSSVLSYAANIHKRFNLHMLGETDPIRYFIDQIDANKILPAELSDVVDRNLKELLGQVSKEHPLRIIQEPEQHLRKEQFYCSELGRLIPHLFSISLNFEYSIEPVKIEIKNIKNQRAMVAIMKVNSILHTTCRRFVSELKKIPFNEHKAQQTARWCHKSICNVYNSCKKERQKYVILWDSLLKLGEMKEPEDMLRYWNRMAFRLNSQ